jgi:hypothetical protein
MKRVAILQSNYIPWRGYFDLIDQVDLFVLYDIVQYTKNDWRNRNIILPKSGPLWLTIPVRYNFGMTIEEARIDGNSWATRHWRTITQSYARAPYITLVEQCLGPLYAWAAEEDRLSVVNEHFLRAICDLLDISTPIIRPAAVAAVDDPSERLLRLLTDLQATHYLSGPAAKAYLNEDKFERAGIAVEWMDYAGYPSYRQNTADFTPNVSIIDLIAQTGPDALTYVRRGNSRGSHF